jgi:site-specific recombinase XerD
MRSTRQPTREFTAEAKAWIENLRLKGRSTHTIQVYQCALDSVGRFLAGRRIRGIKQVIHADLAAWQEHLRNTGCKAATLDAFTKIAQRWFAWQVASGRLFQSPAELLRPTKVGRPLMQCPSEANMKRLLDSIRKRDRLSLRNRAILEIAYSTGARLEEMALLEMNSLNLRERTVRLYGKGQREREVPLTRTAVRAIRTYLDRARPRFAGATPDQRALFVGARGKRRMAKVAFTRVIQREGRKVGLVITPHDIRRAFATHLLAGGAHPAVLKELLGHQGYTHLHHYLRLHPESAINAVRRSRIFR